MINYQLRQKYREQLQQGALFSSLQKVVEKSLSENSQALQGNFAKGETNQFALTKQMIKRLDMQILLLLQLHKDLKKIKK